MAYTRAWDNAAPPGSALANTLDTIIQEFRQDTQQRISSLLAPLTTIDTDPLQLKPTAFGAVTGAVRVCQPFTGRQDTQVGSNAIGLDGVDGLAHFSAQGNGFVVGTFDVAGACQLPVNAQVTRVRVYGERVTGSGTTRIRLYSLNTTTGVYTLIATLGALSTTGYDILDSGVIAVALGNFNQLIVRADGSSATTGSLVEVAIGGCQVTYDIAAGSWVP